MSSRNVTGLVRQSIAYGIWLLSFLVVYLVAIRDLGDLRTPSVASEPAHARGSRTCTRFSDPGEFRTHRQAGGPLPGYRWRSVALSLLWRQRLLASRCRFSPLLAAAVFLAHLSGSLGLYAFRSGASCFSYLLFPIVVICLAEGITRIGGIRPPVLAIGLLVGHWRHSCPCCRHGVETVRRSPERRAHRISAPRGGDELAAGGRPLSLPRLAVCVPLLRRVRRLRRGHQSSPRALAFTPDGRWPTADDTRDRVRLFEPSRRDARRSAPGNPLS